MSPSQKSVARLRGKVEDLMKSGNVMPWPEVRDRLNATLRGWSGYFHQGDCYPAYRAVNHYVYQRVRVFPRRRHKVPSLGMAQFSDRVVFGKQGVLRLFVVKASVSRW
jgi:RNA-directed DNA polymerase